MKLLFFMGHDGFVRNFEGPLHLLATRGHSVVLALSGRRPLLMSETRSIDDLCERHQNITYVRAPKGRDGDFAELASALWGARDYLRYLEPEYANADKLRSRARESAPAAAQRFGDSPLARSRTMRRVVDWALRSVAESLPGSDEIGALIRAHDPEIVLVTPQIGFRSTQNTVVRTARSLGVRTALLVHSWDNLTNKGLIHDVPDRVLVWNDAQRNEAVELHGVDPNQVVVTGAQSFDHWFNWEARESREQFCEKVGLDPSRKIILYVCSSAFIAPEESAFVERWIARLRSSGIPGLEEAGVLVRPHPQLLEHWRSFAAPPGANVSLWPNPDGELTGWDARNDYVESLRNAAAVVGINTSAFVEAAIMDRPTFTVLEPDYRETQVGTLHFRYLTEGALTVAKSMDEHLDHLHRALRGEDLDRGRSRRFVRSFVRPRPERSSTEWVVDAIEALSSAPLPDDAGARRRHRLARRLLLPTARRMRQARDSERRRAKAQRAAEVTP